MAGRGRLSATPGFWKKAKPSLSKDLILQLPPVPRFSDLPTPTAPILVANEIQLNDKERLVCRGFMPPQLKTKRYRAVSGPKNVAGINCSPRLLRFWDKKLIRQFSESRENFQYTCQMIWPEDVIWQNFLQKPCKMEKVPNLLSLKRKQQLRIPIQVYFLKLIPYYESLTNLSKYLYIKQKIYLMTKLFGQENKNSKLLAWWYK